MRRALIFLVAALLASATGVQAQNPGSRTIEGVLHVVWGDPQAIESGPAEAAHALPRYRAFLTSDDGQSHEIEPVFGPELTPGELVGLNGRRVRVSGTDSPLRRTAMGASAALLQVTDVAAVSAATALNSPVWPVQVRPYAILLCKFSDIADEPFSFATYEAMYGSGFGGADDFFREASGGRLTIRGTKVYGWYTMPQPRSSYIVNDRANLTALFNDCVRQADSDIDFRQVVGIGMHFNATLDCCSWGGSRTTTLDGEIKTFATMWNASWARSGTSWHEMGHSVGLPHSGGPYGRTYDSVWDVMSSSTSGRYLNREFGFGGAHFVGYHKNLLGLIPAGRRVTVTSGTWQGVLEPHAPLGTGSGPVLLTIPLADPSRSGQMYTVELRAKTGYDLRLPRAAVIIHSVVPGRAEPAQLVDSDGDGDTNDDGATWTVGETFSDVAAGIEVRIDSLTSRGVALTVSNGTGRGPVLAASGITLARSFAQAGSVRDSVRVSGMAWRASQRRSWLSLVRAAGPAGDYLVYELDVRALAPGRYADTLRVHGVSVGPSVLAPFVVEVVVGPGTDVAALSVTARRDSARTGITSAVDSAYLALEGRFAGSAWTAQRSSARLFIGLRQPNGLFIDATTTQLSGSGSRWLYFRRGAESTPGRTVDTLSVTIAQNPPLVLHMVDTLVALTPVTVRLQRQSGQHRAALGALGTMDSVLVRFDDPRGDTFEWTASNRRTTANRLRKTRGLGEQTVFWMLDASQVAAPGVQVDTIFVCSAISIACATFVDTLTFEAAPDELRLSASGGRASVVRSTRQRSDSVFVQLMGATGRTRTWTATSRSTRIAFHSQDAFTASASGSGSGILRWSRNTNDLPPGTYIDTLRVFSDGLANSPALYVDTLVVSAATHVAGDVDGDGSITTGDALIILRSLVGLPIMSGAVIARGDANCDGQVTAADAQLILQLDVGVPPQAACLGRPLGSLSP